MKCHTVCASPFVLKSCKTEEASNLILDFVEDTYREMGDYFIELGLWEFWPLSCKMLGRGEFFYPKNESAEEKKPTSLRASPLHPINGSQSLWCSSGCALSLTILLAAAFSSGCLAV